MSNEEHPWTDFYILIRKLHENEVEDLKDEFPRSSFREAFNKKFSGIVAKVKKELYRQIVGDGHQLLQTERKQTVYCDCCGDEISRFSYSILTGKTICVDCLVKERRFVTDREFERLNDRCEQPHIDLLENDGFT